MCMYIYIYIYIHTYVYTHTHICVVMIIIIHGIIRSITCGYVYIVVSLFVWLLCLPYPQHGAAHRLLVRAAPVVLE